MNVTRCALLAVTAGMIYYSVLPATSFKTMAEHIVQEGRLSRLVMHQDNQEGQIAWAKVFYMEALLNLYEITGQERYLNLFRPHALDLMAQENKAAGRIDDDGRLRRGWQCSGAYTFSRPLVLTDASGRPVLQLQGKRWGQNNTTSVQISHQGENAISILVTNSASRFREEYTGLTIARLRSWAPTTHTMDHYLSVTVLAPGLPARDTTIFFQPARVTLTTFHSPRILVPLLRFVYLVKKENLAHWQSLADTLLNFCSEVFTAYDSLWRPHGYYINEPGIPFAYAGLPVPYNILADHGRCLLYWAMLTGEARFVRRLALISMKMFNAFQDKDGKVILPYAYGPLYEGWQESHGYAYPHFRGARRLEDVSHLKSTLVFAFDVSRYDLAYINGFRIRLGRIFQQVYREGDLAYYVDGSGPVQPADVSGSFVLLFPFDRENQQRCLRAFQNYLAASRTSVHTLLGLTYFLWLHLDAESAP